MNIFIKSEYLPSIKDTKPYRRIDVYKRQHKVKVVTNMGAANPAAAARKCAKMAKEKNLTHIKIAYVEGDDISCQLQNYMDYQVMETGQPLMAIDGDILSANGYIGIKGIVAVSYTHLDVYKRQK